MISLEQIRLLEGKITRAIDLIRILKEENTTLRTGLDSAQHRMKELESLVEGFKSDQKEIESVIVRTLKNLDDLEDTAAEVKKADLPREAGPAPRAPQPVPPMGHAANSRKSAATGVSDAEPGARMDSHPVHESKSADLDTPKGELDIF